MAKKVSSAKFQTSLFIAGLGVVGDTLPSPSKTFPNLKMAYGSIDGVDGLHVEAGTVKFTVPSTNCVFVVYAPGETLIVDPKKEK